MTEKELKAAINGLEKDGFIYSPLWHKLVDYLIGILELDNNLEAVRFWKNR